MSLPDQFGGNHSRRKFLENCSAVAGIAVAVANQVGFEKGMLAATADELDSPIPIIDTHQHLWDLSRFDLPWLKENAKLARSFLLADYETATKGLNVVKTIYMEVDVQPSQQVKEAEYVLELCRNRGNRVAAAVISGRPAAENFADYIGKYRDSPYIKGVRQVLHSPATPQGYCLASAFVRGIQLLGQRGMSFDLCMRSGELSDADRLVGQCPGTRFILDHCGNIPVEQLGDRAIRQRWEDGMKRLAQHDHVVCKVSGIVASAPENWQADDLRPVVEFTLETFGPDRVMFGGDWPVCTLRASYRQWLEALQAIVREISPQRKRKLFHDNATKFYGLKDEPLPRES